jgi:hypothetical protein
MRIRKLLLYPPELRGHNKNCTRSFQKTARLISSEYEKAAQQKYAKPRYQQGSIILLEGNGASVGGC